MKRSLLWGGFIIGVVALLLKCLSYSGKMRYVFRESTYDSQIFIINDIEHYPKRVFYLGRQNLGDLKWNVLYLSRDKNNIVVDGVYLKYINIVFVRSFKIKKPVYELFCLDDGCMDTKIRLRKSGM